MKTARIIVLLSMLAFVGFYNLGYPQTRPRVQPPPAQHIPAGRHVEVEVRTLPRFGSPILTRPAVMPPVREGFQCRWHPTYGWVYLPAATAPVEMVLPATYELPATVQVFQPAGSSCQCPWCGHPLTIR